MMRDWVWKRGQSYPGAVPIVRGRGLSQGLVTPVDDDVDNQIAKKAFERGVVIETSGANDEVLKLLPALTIEDELLMRGLEVIERSLAEVLSEKGVSARRSEEHTSELQSLMRISYAAFCLTKKIQTSMSRMLSVSMRT